MSDMIIQKTQGSVLILEINRPEALNALNTALIQELHSVFEQLRQDPAVEGIILTGSGRSFVAGADIEEMKAMSASEARDFSHRGQALTRCIESFPKPVIAAVNGFALGGGNELAMAAHIRIASETAKFGQPESGLGLIPGFGGTQRLARLIGSARAYELNLTGQVIRAEQALDFGLVSRVVPKEELMDVCLTMMQSILEKSPSATALILEAMGRGKDLDLQSALELEADLFALSFTHRDREEGISAFLEKRKANFRSVDSESGEK